MKIKEKKELQQKSIKELKLLLQQVKEELFRLRLEKFQKKLKNTSSIFQKRKDIARILTILKEKEFKHAHSTSPAPDGTGQAQGNSEVSNYENI